MLYDSQPKLLPAAFLGHGGLASATLGQSNVLRNEASNFESVVLGCVFLMGFGVFRWLLGAFWGFWMFSCGLRNDCGGFCQLFS